jgi:tetratricopeptide (TPR) repeat protein
MENARGFYMTRADGSYAFVPRYSGKLTSGAANAIGRTEELLDTQSIFFHEYAHHLQLQDAAVAIPTWAVEGFAEFFATAEVQKDGSVLIGKFPEYRVFGVRDRTSMTLAQILGDKLPDKITIDQIDALYARGWLLTHFFAMTETRKGQFSRYIAGIQKGETPLESAQAAFGDLKTLEREVNDYQRQSHIMGLRLDAKVIPISDIAIRDLGPGEAAIMPVKIRSKRGVDASSAPAVAAQAQAIAAKFPHDAAVQSALAEADFDNKDYAGAKEAAARAIEANPRDDHALLYEGRAQMALARSAPKSADWDAVRAWFTKANALDTENAEPLEAFYESFAVAGQPPSDNATDALLYATALAPRDMNLRMEAVAALISGNRLSDARTLMAPVAYQPHLSAEVRELTGKIMAALAKDDVKSAIALLNSNPGSMSKPAKK